MRPEPRVGRLALACLAAAVASAPARAAEVAAGPFAPGAAPIVTRDLAMLSAREALLGEQAGTARASARWRLGALYRLAVVQSLPALPPASRARAVDAGARAFARALAEERALAAENARAHAQRLARAEAGADEPIGAAPPFVSPIPASAAPGAVLARFGVGPDRETGLLVARAGVRLAARPGQNVLAPAAATVVSVVPAGQGEGAAVVLDHGAGWTTIVGGLETTTAAAGQAVALGQPLGVAAGGAAGVIFEVWRGRHPVDPLLLVGRAPRAESPRPSGNPTVD